MLVKLEFLNPSGSIKDRMALAVIEDAERRGLLKAGGTVVEASGGNAGIALAMVAALRGYKAVITMPEDVPEEHRARLQAYGAELKITPSLRKMAGAVEAAEKLAKETPGCFYARQFENEANVRAHRETTAREILEGTGDTVDAFVMGVGTGATVTGVGGVLKEQVPGAKVVVVEPKGSPVLSMGRAGRHLIAGIGPDFVPPLLNMKVVDEVTAVEDGEAWRTAKLLSKAEGFLVGPSSGANVFAALKVAERLGRGKVVVTVLPDSGDRYLGTL